MERPSRPLQRPRDQGGGLWGAKAPKIDAGAGKFWMKSSEKQVRDDNETSWRQEGHRGNSATPSFTTKGRSPQMARGKGAAKYAARVNSCKSLPSESSSSAANAIRQHLSDDDGNAIMHCGKTKQKVSDTVKRMMDLL